MANEIANKPTPQNNSENQELLVKEFLEIQKLDAANKSKELDIRKEEIKSNESIALASIAAQKEDTATRGHIFADVHKSKLKLFGLIGFLVAVVITVAMLMDKTEVALEIIKIGGAVLLGYLAGVNKGKAQILEKTRQRDQED
ncbi:hypothetical protein [Paralysiella testudinis]|uniref:Uncharacterized protein n=1 Tax=Paralysiella testudinis TaxID=2809020 RepID=A0A892ZGG4_9NEIS|nr:hypothetical protein [Paralysiella testudinis]QRQ80674.1 hypothetical protein JQU52_07800 [Paralysiella testudinis]